MCVCVCGCCDNTFDGGGQSHQSFGHLVMEEFDGMDGPVQSFVTLID